MIGLILQILLQLIMITARIAGVVAFLLAKAAFMLARWTWGKLAGMSWRRRTPAAPLSAPRLMPRPPARRARQ